ncbi:ABC transporter substrate-binding protein [Sneathiella glossodoripedis]|uniref:ABC transporter substrate-binding protein n=1 Tax=Sneathiella glossodoripedis TaxID=418853 RepID=UPI00046E9770|nr:ABC transporter substrate-binding protein [Sneathiella glossodoripedis]
MKSFAKISVCLLLISALFLSKEVVAANIEIGLNADMSSSSALAGRAIQRGAQIAIDEINEGGGILGRQLELVTRDHRGNPARGKDNILELSERENIVAVLGGLHTPVVLAELDLVHKKRLPYLIPWAAGTQIIQNNHSPNFVFRVSVRDEYASSFLLSEAKKLGYKRPCLLLENTGWGRSNNNGFHNAASTINMPIPATQWFNWGQTDFQDILKNLVSANCDVIMFVGNSREGKHMVQSLASLPVADQLPIISHWGITGADFVKVAGPDISKINLVFLQTYSFLEPTDQRLADKFVKHYFKRFPDTKSVTDIKAPVGSAHAYDLVHILATAIRQSGSLDRTRVREELERIEFYSGLVRKYKPPFTEDQHDALDSSDFRLARFNEAGVIIPLESNQ